MENLTKAMHSADFLLDELRAENSNCSAVESLNLLPIIYQAQEVRDKISALILALEADKPNRRAGNEDFQCSKKT